MKRGDLIRHKRTLKYAVVLNVKRDKLGRHIDIYAFGRGVLTRSPKHFIIVSRV